MNQKIIDKIMRDIKRRMENRPRVIYCSRCQMWFDTKNGWFAKTSAPLGPIEITTDRGSRKIINPPGIPICPACGAPLFEIDAEEFYENNRKQGRLEEVMTWEWPNGSFWKKVVVQQ